MRTQPEFAILPNHAGYEGEPTARFHDFLHHCRVGEVDSWTCKKSAQWHDVYVFWFGEPVFELAGLGVCDSEVREFENDDWDRTDARVGWFCDFRPLIAFDNPVTRDDINADPILDAWWRGRPFQGGPKAITQPRTAWRLIQLILRKNPDDSSLAAILAKFRPIGGVPD